VSHRGRAEGTQRKIKVTGVRPGSDGKRKKFTSGEGNLDAERKVPIARQRQETPKTVSITRLSKGGRICSLYAVKKHASKSPRNQQIGRV